MKKASLLIVLTACVILSAQPVQKYITVTGTSEIIKKADQLKFTVYIKTVDESVEASKISNDKNLVDLFIILKGSNIPSEDTEISPISFGRNYERTDGGLVHKGYFTSINVSFLLQDLKKYYDITNKLSTNDVFEINAEYVLSDYEEQHRSAFEKAILAAREKAEYLTAALNMKTGEVLEIEEQSGLESFSSPMNVVTRETSGGNISGNVSIRRSVKIKFAIHSVR